MFEGLSVWQAVLAAFTVGGAWGGAKVALNGTRANQQEIKVNVKELSADLKQHVKDDHEVQDQLLERTVRIETKLDTLLDK